MTTSSWPRLAALLLTTTALAGCGGDSGGGDASGGEQACRFGAAEKRSAYRPLPSGLRYEKATKAMLEAAERNAGEAGVAGVDARPVHDRSGPVAVVILQGFEEPTEDDERFREGYAKGAGGEGTKPEEVEIDGTELIRVDARSAVLYARMYDGCRVVSVYATEDAAARRVARAVLT